MLDITPCPPWHSQQSQRNCQTYGTEEHWQLRWNLTTCPVCLAFEPNRPRMKLTWQHVHSVCKGAPTSEPTEVESLALDLKKIQKYIQEWGDSCHSITTADVHGFIKPTCDMCDAFSRAGGLTGDDYHPRVPYTPSKCDGYCCKSWVKALICDVCLYLAACSGIWSHETV